MKVDFETVNCPLCGSEEYRRNLSAPDRFNLNGATFKITRCRNCEFTYLNPRPTRQSISEFYKSEAYQPFLSTQSRLNWWDRLYVWVRNYTVKNKRRKIEKLQSKGVLLDVGCGTGEFLNEMQSSGWQVTGLETDKAAAEFAQRNYALNVFAGDLAASSFVNHSFDVITLWHVLEHLPNPKESLGRARDLLKMNGWILVVCPNISSFDARFYRENWVALDAPRHLLHFDPQSMATLCDSQQLHLKEIQQLPLDAFYNCLLSEQLIVAKNHIKKVFTPFYLKRAFVIAMISIVKSTRLRRPENRSGSSILYSIQKKQAERAEK